MWIYSRVLQRAAETHEPGSLMEIAFIAIPSGIAFIRHHRKVLPLRTYAWIVLSLEPLPRPYRLGCPYQEENLPTALLSGSLVLSSPQTATRCDPELGETSSNIEKTSGEIELGYFCSKVQRLEALATVPPWEVLNVAKTVKIGLLTML